MSETNIVEAQHMRIRWVVVFEDNIWQVVTDEHEPWHICKAAAALPSDCDGKLTAQAIADAHNARLPSAIANSDERLYSCLTHVTRWAPDALSDQDVLEIVGGYGIDNDSLTGEKGDDNTVPYVIDIRAGRRINE